MRKPYQTLTRARASVYLRECLTNEREPNICEAVRRGVGANRASARRALAYAIKLREFDPCTTA